jgi:type IV pilus assembly protein PilB
MTEFKVSASAQQALLKLLQKLNLIDQATATQRFTSADLCPIGWLSQAGKLDEWEAIRAVAEHLILPQYRVDRTMAGKYVEILRSDRFASIPVDQWKQLRALPVELKPKSVVVAFANPLDRDGIRALEFQVGSRIEVGIGSEGQMLAVLGKQFNELEEEDFQALLSESPSVRPTQEPTRFESNVFTPDLDAVPVVRLVNKILSEAIERGASDLHLTPDKEGLQARIRIDGIMQQLLVAPESMQSEIISRIKLLAGMDIAERRKPQDGRLRIKSAFGVKDLRISTVPNVFGENLVARILSPDVQQMSFPDLGLSELQVVQLRRILLGSSRVVLVTGPTGSGKTSTLYAGLQSLNDSSHNIITIEDPIEYRVPGVNQIQVNSKVGLSFAEGLRSVLRQDPDIVMVGEIRDLETAQIAMQAAQTGHLVLSTIHTNSAASAVTRLVDLGVAPHIVASSIGAIIAQRLTRKLCKHCAIPVSDEHWKAYEPLGFSRESLREPVGCAECRETGYHGRLGVYSILEVDDLVRDVVRSGGSEAEIERHARAHNFKNLNEAGWDLVQQGITSLDEIERNLGPLQSPSGIAVPAQASNLTRVRSTGMQKPRVLLVEDNEDARAVLKMVLEAEFYEVVEAADGVEAMEAIYREIPQVIVADFMMPRMNGLQLLQKLRADVRTKGIPVLMLTAADSEENEVQMIDSGADDFVSKGSETKVMLARVQRLLSREP